MSRSFKRPSRIKQFILWSLLLVGFLIVGTGLYGYFWLQSYLKSDAIRVLVEARLGESAKGAAKLASIEWSGPAAYVSTASITPAAPRGWRKIEAEGVQAHMDWSGIRQGVWRVPSIAMDWFKVELSPQAQAGAVPAPQVPVPASAVLEAAPVSPAPPPSAPAAPAWLRAWIPTRTEIQQIEVAAFQVQPPKGVPGVRVDDVRVLAKPAVDPGAWTLEGTGGKIELPGMKEAFELTTVKSRIDARMLTLNHAQAAWLGESEVTARGELPFEPGRPWKFSGVVANLDLRHLLEPAWQNKLRGVLEADYNVDATGFTAKVTVKNGVVENLPLLDRVADFTRADRFRRVALEDAKADVERRGNVTQIRRLVLQSSGLLRVEGDLTITGEALEGLLYVGVSTDALRWIPGAQAQVFTETRPGSPPGFVWAPVQLSGTVASPREDLSNRLLAALGRELIAAPLDVAGKGVDLLGNAAGAPGKGAAEMGKEVLKTTEEAAGKAVETGVDLLKGVVPLFGK